MSRPVWALFTAAVAWPGGAAVAGPDAVSSAGACRPTDGVLAADATLAGAAGAYRLTMVRTDQGGEGESAGKSSTVSGSLRLHPSASGAFAPASDPLRGATDVDLRAVGAQRVGDPASEDPAAPGVLVLESRVNGAPRILLRLGSEANRPDQLLFDGGYTVLDVGEITAAGFAGAWRSAAEHRSAAGHFCAVGF